LCPAQKAKEANEQSQSGYAVDTSAGHRCLKKEPKLEQFKQQNVKKVALNCNLKYKISIHKFILRYAYICKLGKERNLGCRRIACLSLLSYLSSERWCLIPLLSTEDSVERERVFSLEKAILGGQGQH
jgi:hypothetical protein